MEKMLWTAVAVLWMSLLGGIAMGNDVRPALNAASADAVVVQNASLGSPVRVAAIDRMVRPVVEIAPQGSGELAGAALIGAAFVFRAARRRGLV